MRRRSPRSACDRKPGGSALQYTTAGNLALQLLEPVGDDTQRNIVGNIAAQCQKFLTVRRDAVPKSGSVAGSGLGNDIDLFDARLVRNVRNPAALRPTASIGARTSRNRRVAKTRHAGIPRPDPHPRSGGQAEA